MNKIKILGLLAFIMLIFIIGLTMTITHNKSPNVQNFECSDYQYYIDHFPAEENIGETSDLKKLLNNVETLWIKEYGKRIKEQKPYQIYYDSDNDVLLFRGTLNTHNKGGVAHMLIKKSTGDVLAVWHEK